MTSADEKTVGTEETGKSEETEEAVEGITDTGRGPSDPVDAEPQSAPTPEDDIDAIIAKQKRQRVVMMVGVAAVAVLAIAAVSLVVALQPDPLCDPDDIDAFVGSGQLPATSVHRVCKLPDRLEEGLRGAESAPPEYAELMLYAAIAEKPSLITNVCPKGIGGMADAGAVAAHEKTDVFLDACDLSDTGINVDRARGAPMHLVVLAVAVWGVIGETDGADAERIVNRILAGP